MIKLKSYDIIHKISESLYLDIQNDDEVLSRLKEKEEILKNVISEDFQILFNKKLIFISSVFYYDDMDYRQSATGVFLKATILNEKDFLITFECLIDYNKILVAVKDEYTNNDLQAILGRIRKAYNSEGKAELKEI